MNMPRPEHPRPDFYRPNWLNLNGVWEFEFFGVYPVDSAEKHFEKLQQRKLSKEIIVPFPYQSPLSGIGHKGIQPCVWYRRHFDAPEVWQSGKVLLHFGAVDYFAKVILNGTTLGTHRGGHVPFSFDITPFLRDKQNELIVGVYDFLDVDQPRGKQSWADPVACWYTQTTGIWQTVWLESVPENYLESARLIPDLDDGSLAIWARPNAPCQGFEILAEASYQGAPAGSVRRKAAYPMTPLRLTLDQVLPWSPEAPHLYDLEIKLMAGDRVVDRVSTYFGMRKVSLSNGSLLLNNEPYYQRLVLDQGFWPDGLYTAPSDDALKADVEWGKKLGFNGCRKHMKVEDPRFLYWADKLGFLVWGEFPAYYELSLSAQAKYLPEWQASIERDINHPSIVAWTPFNESWGIKDVRHDLETQRWVRDVVQMTKLIDPTRLVIDNDGWEHIASDIYGYHDYTANGEQFRQNFIDFFARAKQMPDAGTANLSHHREMMVDGAKMPDMPVMNTEFGGIAYVASPPLSDAWGYAGIPATEAEFTQRYEETFNAMYSLPELCGYVYTQLTDVEQEINGLLTADRRPKFDVEWLRTVNQWPAACQK